MTMASALSGKSAFNLSTPLARRPSAGFSDESYTEGIQFYTSSYEEIINYLKPHAANLTKKHQATNRWFKPVVRVFKNLRRRLVSDGELAPGDAPSYYVEG